MKKQASNIIQLLINFFLILLLIIIIFLVIIAVSGKSSLLAISDLTVVKSIDDISSPQNRQIVKSGTRLNLIDCVNIKHYILPKVQLENKTEVYIIDGQFKIEHFPIWHTEGNIVFSDCPW